MGTLGLVDGDSVEESNLHRQILHATSRVGMSKVDSAMMYLKSYVLHSMHDCSIPDLIKAQPDCQI